MLNMWLLRRWRNVLRNRRRSAITVSSIAIGLAALTFLRGFIDGMNSQMIDNTTRYLAGDVQVHMKGYHADPNLDLAIAQAAPVVQTIARDPDVPPPPFEWKARRSRAAAISREA